MPGMPTSSTITSGRDAAMRALGLGGAAGLVHLDLDVLEGRPQQLAEPSIVVDQQQAHSFPPGSKAFVDRRYRPLGPDLESRPTPFGGRSRLCCGGAADGSSSRHSRECSAAPSSPQPLCSTQDRLPTSTQRSRSRRPSRVLLLDERDEWITPTLSCARRAGSRGRRPCSASDQARDDRRRRRRARRLLHVPGGSARGSARARARLRARAAQLSAPARPTCGGTASRNVVCFPWALGAEPALAELHLSARTRATTGSTATTRAAVGNRSVAALDEILAIRPPVDVVKLDVQGIEEAARARHGSGCSPPRRASCSPSSSSSEPTRAPARKRAVHALLD